MISCHHNIIIIQLHKSSNKGKTRFLTYLSKKFRHPFTVNAGLSRMVGRAEKEIAYIVKHYSSAVIQLKKVIQTTYQLLSKQYKHLRESTDINFTKFYTSKASKLLECATQFSYDFFMTKPKFVTKVVLLTCVCLATSAFAHP